MDSRDALHHVIQDLVRLVPGIGDPDRLAPLLAVAPVPNAESILPLLMALARLRCRVQWIAGLAPADWPTSELLETFLAALNPHAELFHNAARPQLGGIKREYGVYSAILDNRATPPPGIEHLRAILVLCSSRWGPQGTHVTTLDIIASAARGMARQTGTLSSAFSQLGEPGNLQELAAACAQLNLESHEGLQSVWRQVIAELKRKDLVEPPREGPREGKGGTRPRESAWKGKGKRALRKPRTLRVRAKTKTTSIHERAEAPEDRTGAEVVADVPTRSRSLPGVRRDLFQAKQAIWSANSLLLTENIESLGIGEASALGRALVVEGDKMIATMRLEDARAVSRLAVCFATGRAANALARISTGGLRNAPEFAWTYDLEKGLITQSVLRPDSAYTPTDDEQGWLEPTTQQMSLAVAPELAAFLRRARTAGVPLWDSDPAAIKADLRAACHLLSDSIGLKLSPGRVRRTLACLLQEHGRDVAATMLITGDTQGLSTAPLYYCAPQEIDLQQLYGKVSAVMFGGEEPKPTAIPGRRLGSALLVRPTARKSFSRGLGAALHGKNAFKPELASAVTTHNAVANHTIAMFLAAAGHRPVDELFRLTRTSLDLDGLGALFQDKKVDLAHETRFAALPMVLADQLRAYIDHLRGMLSYLPEGSVAHLHMVLAGKAPLLFLLQQDGSPKLLSIGEWLAQAPPAWQALPPNHGRTTIATRGREAGGHAEAIAIHLGHLEAVGFPFSVDGPTEPILLAAELAPVLDRVARDGGWKTRSGYPCDEAEDIWRTFGRLRDWTKDVSELEARQAKEIREAAKAQRAEVRSHRLRGELWVLEALAEKYPLAALAAQAMKSPNEGDKPEHLGPDEVIALQEGLQARADGDMVATLAAMNALRRVLVRLKKKFRWTGYVPFPWRTFRRAETTPFFPGMMLARVQIETLRAQFEKIPNTPDESVTPWDWQCARAALALCLFGFVDDQEQVIGVLRNASRACRSARLPDLLLVPWSDQPCEVAGLRGLAAIAVAAFGKLARRENSEVTTKGIDSALRAMLPSGACTPRMNVLERLCSMTAVANRIELSGAARTALAQSTSAAVHRQQAWMDGDPITAVATSLGEAGANHPPPQAHSRMKRGDSRRQYWELLKLFPSNVHMTVLPRTKVEILPTQAESARNRVVAELQALVADEKSNVVVAALAQWAIKMLTKGTLEESKPAYGTVKTYLTTVGADLVSLTETTSLADYDEAELTQIYVDVVEMKPPERQALAAREVLHFHSTVASQFDLPEIDFSELESYRGKGESNVDAELILPQEWKSGIDYLGSLAREGGDALAQTPTQRRLIHQAKLLLQIIGTAGARSGEPLGMRHVEAMLVEQLVLMAFVPNRNRRIKTRAGRRVVDLTHRFDEHARAEMREWILAERARFSDAELRKAYLFSHFASSLDVSPKPNVRRLASLALGAVTRRPAERLHRGRHMNAGVGLAWFSLAPTDRERVPFLAPLSPPTHEKTGVQFPRDLRRQTTILGHARPLTGIRTYLHFNWLLRSPADRWMLERVNRRTAAVALGVSVFRVDQLRQQNKEKGETQAWLDNGIAPRLLCPAPDAPSVPRQALDLKRISLIELGQLLGWQEEAVASGTAALSAGVTQSQLDLIQQAVEEYSAQIGRDFRSRAKGARVTRRMSAAKHLYKLWAPNQDHAGDKAKDLTDVSRALYALARPTDGDTLVLPKREASLLLRLLTACGHDEGLIELNDHPTKAKFRTLRIKRTADGGYTGLELKRILGVVWVRDRLQDLAD